MFKCSVFGCNNYGVHKFPNGKILRKKWEEALCRPNFQSSVNSRLCVSHFKSDDYIHDDKLGQRCLKRGVVPSLFPWTDQHTPAQSAMPNIKAEMENPETESEDFGECRFCEARGEHSSMMSGVGGDRANYFDMLLECFNIFLSHRPSGCVRVSLNSTPKSLICDECAARLRDARDFKQLALRAQSGLRANTVKKEVSASQACDMDVDVKQESLEPLEPVEPKDLEPEENIVKVEPVDLDIVEHDLIRKPDPESELNAKENGAKEKMDENGSGESDQNAYSCCPDKVEKFLDEYYIGQDDDEEDNPNECDDSVDEFVDVKEIRCDCTESCPDKFNRDDILKSMLDCREQDYYCQHHFNHLNLMILGALNAMANIDSQSTIKRRRKERERAHIVFMFRGIPVCKKFFLFANGLGEHKFKNLIKTFKETGVEAKPHNASTKSVMTAEQKSDVIAFIRNFSEQNSVVLPGRSFSNTDLYILPNIMTRTYIYERYVRTCKADKKRPVSRPLWKRAWDDFFPNGTFDVPLDSCKTCKDFVSDLSKPRTEDTKIKCLKNALDHLTDIQVQKTYYQSIIAQVTPSLLMNVMSLGQHAPCSYDGLVHYSFDYLQQIHLPHYPDEERPLNFLDTYKVSLFGVAIEPLQKFVLYVIPEYVPKGTNLVVSLLHHFFDTYGLGETNAVCHAVANQSKNSTIIQYALWRVMSGLHKNFQMSFLPAGHTKFAPDIHFGLFKSKFRQFAVNCLQDICEIAVSVDNSITSVIVGNEAGKVYVNTYDWTKFFSEINPAPIPNLVSYHHFKADTTNSGSIMCSKLSPNDYSDQVTVLDSVDTIMPDFILAQMSYERQKYLYENVRSHVWPAFQDLLCPTPTGRDSSVHSKLQKDSDEPNSSHPKANPLESLDNGQGEQIGTDQNLGNKRKASVRVCSYCGIPGHRNQYRFGVYSCTKRKMDMEGSTSK